LDEPEEEEEPADEPATDIALLEEPVEPAKDDVKPEPVVIVPVVRPEPPKSVLEARELTITARGNARPDLDRLSLVIERGETVVLFGERGCGKEALIRAANGALARHEATSGTLTFRGEDTKTTGVRVAYLPGPFLHPLSPNATVAAQLSRVIARRLNVPPGAGREELRMALAEIDSAVAFETLDKRADELAPETLALALLACAMAQAPDLLLVEHLVADLPLMQARELIGKLKSQQKRLGFAILYSARGAHVVNWIGGRVVVLRAGRVIEEGTVERLASGAAHAYTRTLFQALPRISTEGPARAVPRGEPMLQVRNLDIAATGKSERALSREGLTFELRRGASLALVGEDGSGRHKLARALIGLERPGAGRIVLDSVDIGILNEGMLQRMRRRVAMIAGTDDVLDGRMMVWDTVAEPLRAHLSPTRDVLSAQTEGALKRVGLAAPLHRVRVAQLSNFDRRRLQIARAIVTQPHIAIIDEPLRGLDAFAQGVIRDLLREFRRTEGPAFLVITADFSVADALSEDAFVFSAGRVVERGPLAQILRNPKELATRTLIDAVSVTTLS
jgi:peptide/nickel transport system ATP-binding protein